jgi:hypothetical protein
MPCVARARRSAWRRERVRRPAGPYMYVCLGEYVHSFKKRNIYFKECNGHISPAAQKVVCGPCGPYVDHFPAPPKYPCGPPGPHTWSTCPNRNPGRSSRKRAIPYLASYEYSAPVVRRELRLSENEDYTTHTANANSIFYTLYPRFLLKWDCS